MRNLLPHFEGQRLGDINATTPRAFGNARRGDGVAVGTIRRDLQCLSSIITVFCDEHDLEFANPVQRYLRRRARQKTLVEAPPRTRYLDHEEEARLLATIRARTQNDPRLRYLAEAVEFAIDTGLRLEEQFSMTWREYDPRRQRVRVRPEIAKSGEERIVPLLTERAKSILAQMSRRLRLAVGPDWIWSRPDGDRYPHRDKAFKSAVAAAGLKDVRWHDLRRTCGCRRIQDHGWKLEEVRMLLGHSSVVVTEKIYAFLRVEDLKAVPSLNRHKAGGYDDA